MTTSAEIVPIDLLGEVAGVEAGPKAITLSRLRSAGFPVPDGVVIPVGADLEAMTPRLAEALDRLSAAKLAVRSSAADEDGTARSGAGRYLSTLHVPARPQSVIDAAREVIASGDGRAMAVLIQPMVAAIAAGAAFSSNPVTGDDEVLVSAVPGLADELLAGAVTGSEWTVSGGTVTHRSGERLDPSLIEEVAVLALRVAEYLGFPADIEWAHDGEQLILLQARPITALPVKPSLTPPGGNWQKEVTHHPAPVAPLVASMMDIEEQAVAQWASKAGLLIERLEQVTVGGELYARPVPIVGDPDDDRTPPWWALAIVARLHPRLRRRLRAARAFVASEIFRDPVGKWENHLKPHIQREIGALRSVDLAPLSDEGLLDHIERVRDFQGRALAVHFELFLPYLVRIHELVLACREMLGWHSSDALRLLAGASPASSEPTRAMAGVAEKARASTAATDLLDGGAADVLSRLREADPVVAAAIDEWTDEYGFRSLSYDWSGPTLAEQPATIVAMLRSELRDQSRFLEATAVEQEARSRLQGSDLAGFDLLLERARAVSPIREDNVQLTVMVPGALLRSAFLEVGRRLAARSQLISEDDVFFLSYGEACTALNDSARQFHGLVRRRRAERSWVLANPGPPLLGDPPAGPPDLRGLPPAARQINSALMWAIDAEFAPMIGTDDSGAISGLPSAAGSHTGTARIVRTEDDFSKVSPGDVVVCPITNPSWSVLFGIAGAFVCDAGGPLSHTAILAREYAIPSVLATGDASRRIVDGTLVTVDGSAGTVTPVGGPAANAEVSSRLD